MALNLNRTYVLLNPAIQLSKKASIAAYYTLAHQTVVRAEIPNQNGLPRYPVPVVLLAQLGADMKFRGRGLGAKTLIRALRHAYWTATSPNGIPSVGVVLDVLDEDALKFYQSFDFFMPLTDKPMKLYVPMGSLEAI